MLLSSRPVTPEGEGDDREPQGAWSSPFSHDRNQSFDNHSFSRMDRPIIPPLLSGLAPGIQHNVASPYRRNSFVAPSIDDEAFVLNNMLAPPRYDDFHTGCLSDTTPATSPARHLDLYEMNHIHKSINAEEKALSRDAIVTSPTLCSESHEIERRTTVVEPEEQHLYREVFAGEIKPYVGLRARLTQIPINRWTVLLLLVLARLIILFETLNTNLTGAQQEASSACAKVEEMSSAMASMPYYVSVGVNELVAMRITDTVRALIRTMNLVLGAIVDLFMFLIQRLYGTITCVADTFVHTLIAVVQAIVDEVVQGLDGALKGVASEIVAVMKVVEGVAKGITFGHVDMSGFDRAIEMLNNEEFIDAAAVNQGIGEFAKAIPDFKQITADVQAVVGLPFTTVQTLLNESFGNWTMDPSDLPTAPKETLTFCTGNDAITTLFEVLFIVAKSAKVVVLVGLLVIILLATASMLWWEVQRYRRTVIKSRVFRDREPMDTVYVADRPLTAGAGLWMSAKASKDPDRQMLIRWVVAYATTYTALFVLALAVGGAFSVCCQYFIMRAVQKETPCLAQEVGTFVENAMEALDNGSTQWAKESNRAVRNIQNDINDHVFVHVQDATRSVVDAINTFEDETNKFLNNLFNGTGFGRDVENTVDALLACIIIDALNKTRDSMLWINAEAHVTFPEFDAHIFSMGGNTSLAGLLTNAGTQTANEITVALNKIVMTLQDGIIQEGLIALVLLLVYVAYVLFATAQAALRMTCLRERKTLGDAEKGAHAIEKPGRTSSHIEGELPRTPRRPSLAPSYRLSKCNVSQLALDLSVVVPPSPDPAGRSPAMAMAHGEAKRVTPPCAAEETPFGDDTFAVGDKEMDDIVHVLRNSGEIAQDSTVRSSGSLGRNSCAMGDEEVDEIIGVLRDAVDAADNPRTQKRQAWIEDVDD